MTNNIQKLNRNLTRARKHILSIHFDFFTAHSNRETYIDF